MANAAERQLGSLGGQWSLFTGNMQKLSGAATHGLAVELERTVLPAANRAAQAITAIFADDTLAPEEKLRRARAVIKRELGPIADDLGDLIDKADIPGHLGDAVGAALPKMASAAADAAPHVASAFVEAWLKSGPWAQLLSALYIGAKINKGRKALGIGGAAAKAAEGLAGRGGTPANPLWVAVVNAGGLPGGGKGPTTAGRRLLPVAKGAARLAGPIAVAEGIREGSEALRDKSGGSYRGHIGTQQIPGGVAGAGWLWNMLLGGRDQGTIGRGGQGIGSAGLLGGLPLVVENRIVLDGRDVYRSTSRVNARRKARK
jgi:hypothetical protein